MNKQEAIPLAGLPPVCLGLVIWFCCLGFVLRCPISAQYRTIRDTDVSVHMISQLDALVSLQKFPYDFHVALGDRAERTHF